MNCIPIYKYINYTLDLVYSLVSNTNILKLYIRQDDFSI